MGWGPKIWVLGLLLARALAASSPLFDCLVVDEAIQTTPGQRSGYSIAREAEVKAALEKAVGGPVTFLAEGGQSLVFKHTRKNGDTVVVRIPRYKQREASWKKSAEAEAAFYAELAKDKDLAPYLRHFPLTVEINSAEGTPYALTELFAGKTLFDALKNPQVLGPETPVRDVIDGAKQLAGALSALHRTNRVHHDVKPGNIVLERTKAGVVWKLIDLGTMATIGAENPIGTPQYMHGGRQSQTYKARAVDDVYSFGLVLRELIVTTKPDTVLAPMHLLEDGPALKRYFEEGARTDLRRRKLTELADRCVRLEIADADVLLKELEKIP